MNPGLHCRLIGANELLYGSCVSGTEATQYGIKFFNLQDTICVADSQDFQDLQDRRESCKSCSSCNPV